MFSLEANYFGSIDDLPAQGEIVVPFTGLTQLLSVTKKP